MVFGFYMIDSSVLILFVMYFSNLVGILYYIFYRGFPTPIDSGWLTFEKQGIIKIKKSLLFLTAKNHLQGLSSPSYPRAWEISWIFIDSPKIIEVRVTLICNHRI